MKMIKPITEKKSPLVHGPINKTPINTDSLEAMTPESDKMVTGIFVNIESPGQTAKICGKYYKGMQYFNRVFQDNERVTIPLSVARFINERCFHEQHTYLLDEAGNPIKHPRPIARYKFITESYVA
jgi:hypothetical protein